MSGRSTPQPGAGHKKQLSQHLSQHLRNVSISNGGRSNDNVLASLRATQFTQLKPVLPAELLDSILQYVDVPDLLRFARVSCRLQEMVYDDTRWVQKLKAMDAWNELEARQRFEQAMKKKMGVQTTQQGEATAMGRERGNSTMLFDAGVEEQRQHNAAQSPMISSPRARSALSKGFEEITPVAASKRASGTSDPTAGLNAFNNVKSIRGHARQEFGRIYAALAPLYRNLAESTDHAEAQLFRTYRDPEQQAQVLSNIKRYGKSDMALGNQQRRDRIDSIIGVFEAAVLQEFELGVSAGDVDGRMRRFASVLVIINGGTTAIESFVANQPVLLRTIRLGNPLDCLDGIAPGHVDLNPSRAFFERLAGIVVEQVEIIDRTFPSTVDVLNPLLTRICDMVISDYLTTLFDEAHHVGQETYVKAVAGTFEQALRFAASLKPSKASPVNFPEHVRALVMQCFEKHVDLYLAEELALFRTKSDAEVGHWERELSEQEASTESFFMSNVNRQAAKRDFLSSFRKVVMMPVSVIPSFGPSKSATAPASTSNNVSNETTESRSRTPTLGTLGTPRASTPQMEAPTTELAAKAALMNSRLEGIRSLFSLDVALNLTHLAKACLDRTATLVQMGGATGRAAKEQCDTIFVTLLDILGERHIKSGFDKAVNHLSNYNPAEVRRLRDRDGNETSEGNSSAGVAPLVTFLELVNIGDLIQQMIDVFYAQELVAKQLVDRDDFLAAAVKAKKRFEQMLDERVAAGLNKGIDVLVDEIEYVLASTQVATDFHPGAGSDKGNGAFGRSAAADVVDIGPSATARRVVDVMRGHVSMLVGSTDKNMLDVFMQEVGLRLFGALCKHLKRQRVSVDGAITLISDLNHYSDFVATLRQKPLLPYFSALRELGAIYLITIDPPVAYFGGGGGGSGSSSGANSAGGRGSGVWSKRGSILTPGKTSKTAAQAKEIATIIADTQRYRGIFGAEEVYEFAQRRADWYLVRGDVERAMYGVGCSLM